MNSTSNYIPLTTSVSELYRQITQLSDAEKRRQLKILASLAETLVSIMQKAIPQPDVVLSVTANTITQEVPYFPGSSSLSAAYGRDIDDSYEYHIRLKVLVAAPTSSTSNDNVAIWSRTLFIDNCAASKLNRQLLARYLFIQAFFGPDSEPLEVTMPVPTSHSCSLCDNAAILSSRVHFKPHDTIEELAADLAFDGINIEV